ncbi:MAG TPA: hypothetical protein VNG33_23470 [Polyangiaceae bacterium]|nr:hypothetical protein [Polyangiaceae bacterium]
MKTWQIPGLGACFVASAASALAAGFQWLPEGAKWTQPAGTASSASVETLVTAEYYGVEALKLWDFDGRTCSLQLEQSSFNAPSPHPNDPVRLCEPKQTQAWQRADVGAGNFVRGISVCTALKGGAGEIRGVELWGAAIDGSGKLKPAKDSAKLEFSHCEKWSARRDCPAGSIATGLRAHTGDADVGAVGLALRCHAIVPSK